METTREELERAFAHYCEVREQAIATGDWRARAALFTEDARYVEHTYGEFRGRRAIEEWIVGVMEPFPAGKERLAGSSPRRSSFCSSNTMTVRTVASRHGGRQRPRLR